MNVRILLNVYTCVNYSTSFIPFGNEVYDEFVSVNREHVEPFFRSTSEKSFSYRNFLPTFAQNIWQVTRIVFVNQFAYKQLLVAVFQNRYEEGNNATKIIIQDFPSPFEILPGLFANIFQKPSISLISSGN
jgi:hypothetical protein